MAVITGSQPQKQHRGFAKLDPARRRDIARGGGKSAHARGTAHEWDQDEAREAGRKGGLASAARRKERKAFAEDQVRLRAMAVGGRVQ